MRTDAASAADSEILALLGADLDAGLRLVLHHLAPRIRGALQREFGAGRAPEIDDALNHSMHRLAERHLEFDSSRGTLRAWLYRIARNRVLDQVDRSRAPADQPMTVTPEVLDRIVWPAADSAAPSAPRSKLLAALRGAILRLPTMQQQIALADLRAGGTADTKALAAELGTSPNSIYVSRNKARKSLRRWLTEEGCEP